MSVLRLSCPACLGVLQVAETLVGKRIRCPNCFVPVQIGTPLASSDAWYIHRTPAPVGPYPWQQIQQMLRWGVLGADDLMKREGETHWRKARDAAAPQPGPFGIPVAAPVAAAPAESQLDGDAEMLLMAMIQEEMQPPRPGGPIKKAKPVRTTAPPDKAAPVWVVEEAPGQAGDADVTDTVVKYYAPGQLPASKAAPPPPALAQPPQPIRRTPARVEDDSGEPPARSAALYFASGMMMVLLALLMVLFVLTR